MKEKKNPARVWRVSGVRNFWRLKIRKPRKSTLLRKLFVPAKNIKYQLNLKTKEHLH